MPLLQAIKGFFRGFKSGVAKGKVSRLAKEASERELKESLRRRRASERKEKLLAFGGLALFIVLVAGGYALWDALDQSGYIPHTKLTTVTFRDWSVGEYKNCTSPNSKVMDDSPQMDCSDLERTEPKIFNVRFYGRTFREDLKNVSFSWRCKKNGEADPAFTCDEQNTIKSDEGH